MTDKEDLLQAIAEESDDDTPRLVLADWLEERGEPLSEFIRVQCELARLPMGHPRRPLLAVRELQLLKEHEQTWTAPLQGWVDEWEFHRGFIERVMMIPSQFVANAEKLFRHAPVRHVHIFRRNHISLGEVESLAGSPSLVQLISLKLNSDHGISDDAVRVLVASPHLSRLTELDLSDNWIHNQGATFLAESPYIAELHALHLRRNPIGIEGMRTLRNRFGKRVYL